MSASLSVLWLLLRCASPDTCGQPDLAMNGPLNGPGFMPPTSGFVFYTAPVPGATHYIWTAPPDALLNGKPSPLTVYGLNGNSVLVNWGYQNGYVCVSAANDCDTSAPVCLLVQPLFSDVPVCPNNNYPAAEVCWDACIYCNLENYQGTTVGFQPNPVTNSCSIIDVHNDQWMGFVAGGTSGTIELTSFNCSTGRGLQLALYDGCAGSTVECNPGLGVEGTIEIHTDQLIPGHTYFIQIDGYIGDECNFSLNAYPMQTFQAMPLGPTPNISGPDTLCKKNSAVYTITPVDNAGSYFWSGPPGSSINGVPTPNLIEGNDGLSVEILFGNVSGNVCVTPINACRSGTTKCKAVEILHTDFYTTLPDVRLCEDDTPYLLPWGEQAYQTGIYQYKYPSSKGCDSFVVQKVFVLQPKYNYLPAVFICTNDTFWVCNTPFTQDGYYEMVCTSAEGCDSVVVFSLITLTSEAVILPGYDTLDCQTQLVTLQASPSAGYKTWQRLPSNQIIGVGNTGIVTQAGTYVLTSKVTVSNKQCFSRDTAVVHSWYDPPGALANGGYLNCYHQRLQLEGYSPTPDAAYQWSGPNGFSSQQTSPLAYDSGVYTLTTTRPGNGCTSSDTAMVSGSTQPLLAYGNSPNCLSCRDSFTTLSVTVAGNGAYVYEWLGPNGFQANGAESGVTDPGQYYILVTDTLTGCNGGVLIEVCSDTLPPNATIEVPDTLSCLVSEVNLKAMANTPALYQWSAPLAPSTLDGPHIWVNSPGTYTLAVQDSLNGCVAYYSVEVAQDTTPPGLAVDAVGADFDHSGTGFVDISVLPEAGVVLTWYYEGVPYSNTTDIDGLSAGEYTLYAQGANGCVNSLTVTVDQASPVQMPDAVGGWLVFPNPANGQLFVRHETAGGLLFGYRMVDETGRLLQQHTYNPPVSGAHIDLSSAPSSLFVLMLHTDQGVLQVKVVKL